jgi:hypothetical protein
MVKYALKQLKSTKGDEIWIRFLHQPDIPSSLPQRHCTNNSAIMKSGFDEVSILFKINKLAKHSFPH